LLLIIIEDLVWRVASRDHSRSCGVVFSVVVFFNNLIIVYWRRVLMKFLKVVFVTWVQLHLVSRILMLSFIKFVCGNDHNQYARLLVTLSPFWPFCPLSFAL